MSKLILFCLLLTTYNANAQSITESEAFKTYHNIQNSDGTTDYQMEFIDSFFNGTDDYTPMGFLDNIIPPDNTYFQTLDDTTLQEYGISREELKLYQEHKAFYVISNDMWDQYQNNQGSICIQCSSFENRGLNLLKGFSSDLLNIISYQDFCSRDWLDDRTKIAWQNSFKPSSMVIEQDGQKKLVMNANTAYAYLLRFTKPGGLQGGVHLNILESIIRSKAYHYYPNEIAEALKTLFANNHWQYTDLVNRNPKLKELDLSLESECVSDDEKKRKTKELFGFLTSDMFSLNKNLFNDIIKLVKANQKYFSGEQLEAVIESLVQKVSASLSQEGFPDNKFYYYAKLHLEEEFGIKTNKPRSEVLIAYDTNNAPMGTKLLIISTEPIDGNAKLSDTGLGIYVKAIDYVQASEVEKIKSYQWKQGDLVKKAKISFKLGEKIEIAEQTSPNYSDFWKDSKMTGLIFVGANRRHDTWIIPEYLAFYTDAGFSFSEEPVETSSLKDFLQSKIESGEIDYMRQDAHSGNNNFADLAQKANILVGKKTDESGKEQVVYLVNPDTNHTQSSISFEEFGSWLTKRKNNGGGNILHMDGRCNSEYQAKGMLTHTDGESLTVLPTRTGVYPLKYYKDDANRALLQGILQEQSFVELRSSMQIDPKYQSSSSNVFSFPDEEHYESTIGNFLNSPTEISFVND